MSDQHQLADAYAEIDDLKARLADAERERNRYRTECVSHRDRARGDYWCWQGDGEDHPESLVCPVLIRPEQLAAIVRDRDEWKEYGQSHARSHEEIREELDALQSRFDAMHNDVACPDCGCADSIDAQSQECGCDSVVCARDGGKTFAQHYMDIAARNAALVDAVEGLRCVAESIVKAGCPRDTDSDGNCGRPYCPYCGTQISAALAAADAAVSDIQPCGHPRSAIVSTDEGTHHCGACEKGGE